MTDLSRPQAGGQFPHLSWKAVDGGEVAPARVKGWRMLVVYRGKHCPLCERYLTTLESLKSAYEEAGLAIMAVSADPLEKAATEVSEQGWSFPVGYGLTPDEMRQLGLYISSPRSAEETDRPFAEPALFVINPKGEQQIIDISNAPFSRPDLEAMLNGLKFVMGNDYPVRGRA